MKTTTNLSQLAPEQLRQLVSEQMVRIEQLTHEVALLKRHKYGRRSEHLNTLQIGLLDDVVEADIASIEAELEQLKTTPAASATKKQPKRTPLPPELPRTEIHHEPEHDLCPAAVSCAGSAKSSARNWITRPASSPSSVISEANGSAMTARR